MCWSCLSSPTSYQLPPTSTLIWFCSIFTELSEIANHGTDALPNVTLLILLFEYSQEKQVISLQSLAIAGVSKLL